MVSSNNVNDLNHRNAKNQLDRNHRELHHIRSFIVVCLNYNFRYLHQKRAMHCTHISSRLAILCELSHS